MPRRQAAPVSPEEVRRTLTDLESQRTYQRRPQLVRVPHDEILRVLQDMDRQRAEDRTRRREAQYQYTPHVQSPATPSPKRPREEEAPPTPPPTQPKRSPKRPRPMRETVQLQRDSVESVLHHHDGCFRAKEQASSTRSWCNEVPLALQVEAPKSFYQAFTGERTLPISHCAFCYRTIQQCGACLPSHQGAEVDVCRECRVSLDRGQLPKACSVNNMTIGCEHRYPEELDDLSPVEERLIALHAPFSYITKFTVDNKTRSGIRNRKHVKGKPGSADVRHLLQVRKYRVERGADFADNLHEDFFPRTFPKLFPWGSGGPKSKCDSTHNLQSEPADRHPNHSLGYWARYVLQRHGGRFATHPVFCFLVFNTLLRSFNRRISMVRVAKDSFHRLEQVYANLTEDRLKRAEAEMRETRTTSDPYISALLRELSIFGHAQPLSNESRLLMRRKIQALNIWAGMPAFWITISPNDINNPVKMKVAIHRLHDHESAKELLADLREKYDRIALSTMDPVSSAIFFHREISLFFHKYVNAGQQSIFEKIS
ncbi:hypothetical protein TOPH_08969 [Tolypocladium ophioglossoides CBS 100239]|uniref:Uncharacterized protein n=1 Tax=Tolypocladium ophioglossoides (strain CBS 100239) TaxID=1163406 RepID=A0A0L0MXA6_TOLOC|nr:hypothetical protein TOPH_08969 [Tolypocladium ophioglossoides CBS 100239]